MENAVPVSGYVGKRKIKTIMLIVKSKTIMQRLANAIYMERILQSSQALGPDRGVTRSTLFGR